MRQRLIPRDTRCSAPDAGSEQGSRAANRLVTRCNRPKGPAFSSLGGMCAPRPRSRHLGAHNRRATRCTSRSWSGTPVGRLPQGGQVSAKRVSTRILGVAAGVTALLGLSTATALAWSPDCPDHNHGSHSQSEHRTPSQPHHWAPAKPTPPTPAPAGCRSRLRRSRLRPLRHRHRPLRHRLRPLRHRLRPLRHRLRPHRHRLRRPTPAPAAPTPAPAAPAPAPAPAPAAPAPAPVPPVVALGIPDTPQPESTPVAPKTPEEGEVLGKKGTREERVLGKVGTREEATTPTTPVTFVQAGDTQDSETLAMTGFNVPILAILGGLALLGGSLLLRRSRAA